MKIVQNYADWKAAVQEILSQLHAVEFYLNDAGKVRKNVMITLLNLANFCDTAAELVEWIESREGMDRHENELLSSNHAQSPIRRLRLIAAADKTQGD